MALTERTRRPNFSERRVLRRAGKATEEFPRQFNRTLGEVKVSGSSSYFHTEISMEEPGPIGAGEKILTNLNIERDKDRTPTSVWMGWVIVDGGEPGRPFEYLTGSAESDLGTLNVLQAIKTAVRVVQLGQEA